MSARLHISRQEYLATEIDMKARHILLMVSIIASVTMALYGGFMTRFRVYELSQANQIESPFYDWYTESEIIVGTTFGGIRHNPNGGLVSLYSYRQQMYQKLWKFCPS